MKAYWLFLSFLISSCTSSLKLTSFNIYHGEKPFQKGESNLNEVAALVNKHKSDVVLLQEVDSMTTRSGLLNNGKAVNLAEELGQKTKLLSYYKRAIPFGGGAYGLGLLSKKEINPISFSLPQPTAGEPRIVLGSIQKIGKKEVLVLGTHLCHINVSNRIAQIKAIVEFVEKQNLPCILAGDFNFNPSSEEYKFITQYFEDAAVVKNNLAFTFPSNGTKERIDFVFLSKKDKWKIVDFEVPQTLASDHLPLQIELKL